MNKKKSKIQIGLCLGGIEESYHCKKKIKKKKDEVEVDITGKEKTYRINVDPGKESRHRSLAEEICLIDNLTDVDGSGGDGSGGGGGKTDAFSSASSTHMSRSSFFNATSSFSTLAAQPSEPTGSPFGTKNVDSSFTDQITGANRLNEEYQNDCDYQVTLFLFLEERVGCSTNKKSPPSKNAYNHRKKKTKSHIPMRTESRLSIPPPATSIKKISSKQCENVSMSWWRWMTKTWWSIWVFIFWEQEIVLQLQIKIRKTSEMCVGACLLLGFAL